MRKVCYTFIFGNYDKLEDPTFINDDWEYIVFSDEPQESEVWKSIVIESDLPRPIIARKVMTCPFLYIDYDVALGISGRIQITSDLNNLPIDDFVTLTHPDRDCVYEEAAACIKYKKDTTDKIANQMAKYRRESYPEDNGMIATGITIRRNTEEVNSFCLDWFKELSTESLRDQLSFNYIAWKRGFKWSTIPYKILFTDFKIHKHK